MNKLDFYREYLPALLKALDEDSTNYGFRVNSPEFYMDKSKVKEIELFMKAELSNDKFIELVENYFDAKSHYADTINGVPLDFLKSQILEEVKRLKSEDIR